MEKIPTEESKIYSEKEPKTSDELIKEDKDLRAEFFELREKAKEEKASQEEKTRIKERLKEINE